MTVLVRQGPSVVITIDGKDVEHLECGAGVQLTPGVAERPQLPWNLQIVRQSDSHVLWTGAITDLPRWAVVVGDDVVTGDSPPAGGADPTCLT